MNKVESISITLSNSRYSPHLSSFKAQGCAGFTLVVGVARDERSPIVGHINHRTRFACATVNRQKYQQIWKQIWSSVSGELHIKYAKDGDIEDLDYCSDEKIHQASPQAPSFELQPSE